MIRIAKVEAFAYRVPIAAPIKVAFGTFRDRPLVLVRVTDTDGAEGWGEAWCNWPAVGAEHRARLIADFGERIIGENFDDPGEVFRRLDRELEVLVLQTGEVAPSRRRSPASTSPSGTLPRARPGCRCAAASAARRPTPSRSMPQASIPTAPRCSRLHGAKRATAPSS